MLRIKNTPFLTIFWFRIKNVKNFFLTIIFEKIHGIAEYFLRDMCYNLQVLQFIRKLIIAKILECLKILNIHADSREPFFIPVTQASQLSGWILSTFKSREKNFPRQSSTAWYAVGWITAPPTTRRTFHRIADLKEMNYHERLRHLGLFSLQRRREFYIIIHIWKGI